METRKITIISTKNNKKTVINTNASTLGELKRALREADVDYEGMVFYEGLTKTELKLDESILPHDVQRINPVTKEPETTNELAFMLTNANKKIKSGASYLSRGDIYKEIKKRGLQDDCLRIFGKNFTMCKTADLISLIENKQAKPTGNIQAEKPAPAKVKTTTSKASKSLDCIDIQARKALVNLVNYLYQDDVIEEYDTKESILDPIADNHVPCPDSPYSDDELEDMFKDIPM